MKDNEIVSLKNDLVFKKTFSDENNLDMLQDLLSSILNIPYNKIKNIKIKNNELIPQRKNEKYSILDINLSADDKLINIEMQVASESFFESRTLYYWAKLYTSELKSGESYNLLQQTICINFLNFNIFDYKKYHSVYELKERENNNLLTDKCQIHFLELKKYTKQNPSSHLEMWLQLINAKTEKDLKIANQSNSPIIKKAVTVIMEMNADERLKEEIRVREKAMLDIIAREKERELDQKAIKQAIKIKNEVIKQLDNAIKLKDNAIKQKDDAIKQKDDAIKQKDDAIKQKDEIKLREIKNLISVFKNFGVSINETISKLMEKCLLTEEEAKNYVKEYWNEAN